MTQRVLVLIAAAALAAGSLAAADNGLRPLLRFPDIHGDTVVFVHAEDVWTVPAAGGTARRLTDDEGEDRHPKLSPDGRHIAWTSEAGGNADVWVMRADGSQPRRLTYHPGDDEVVGWHPQRGTVLFRSDRLSFSRFDRVFEIRPDGTGVAVLPMHEAGRVAVSPDGRLIAYNRIAREDRTWKRYHGGMAQDVFLYDTDTTDDRQLTTFTGTDRLPMWVDGEIVFASDRSGLLNLWSLDPAGSEPRQLTSHETWDVRRPSTADGRRIVYELGGDVMVFDPSTDSSFTLDVVIPVPARETRPYRRAVTDAITHVGLAPKGGRALISARGEVFTVPAEHGPIRNISRTPGARERGATWSPDGTTIVWWSDADGEVDLWTVPADGSKAPIRLTDLGEGYRHSARFSPDGTRIAFADQTLSLRVLDLDTGAVTTIDRSAREPMDIALEDKPISDHTWSPDSRYLAYSAIGEDMISRVFIHDTESGATNTISTGWFNDFSPAFTSDGQHLVYASNRRFNPTLGDFEWEMVFKDMAGLYAVTLTADGRALLPPRSDEVAADDEAPASNEPGAVAIDWNGISSRVQPLPVPRGNYRQVRAAGRRILFTNGDDGDYNFFEFRSLGPQTLAAFDLDERETSTLLEGVNRYEITPDGRHLVWWRDETVGIHDLASGPRAMMQKAMTARGDGGPECLDLSGLEVEVAPREEWRQVFDEAWRLERDFFYTETMHGLDWEAVGARYRALVDRATCAQDLRFIIGELIGELATSHTYTRTGDIRREPDVESVGLLGADWEAAAGWWRITRIYDVPDWSREILPPLAGPGIDVEEGDYLLAVNGAPVDTSREVYAAFQGLAGMPIEITVNDRPTTDGAHTVLVTPLSGERFLRYHAWVAHNRQVVEDASDGRLGYLHFPDTYLGSATEFPKHYYSQVMKEGLVVDGRFNGGGLDPDIFLARLAKKPMSYWTRRYSSDQVTPWYVSRAHMVCLTNRQAGSGGDELPFEFRAKGMGPIIGTRTWGGLVGVSMGFDLMNGASLTAPDYRIYTPEGKWTVENEGVTPDIIVELDPAEMARGWDAQLQKGIEVLLESLENDPLEPPHHPPLPDHRAPSEGH